MSFCYIQSKLFCLFVETHSSTVSVNSIFDAATNNPTALSLEYALAGGNISQFIYRTDKFALLSFYECPSSFANEAIRNVAVYLGENGISVSWDF